MGHDAPPVDMKGAMGFITALHVCTESSYSINKLGSTLPSKAGDDIAIVKFSDAWLEQPALTRSSSPVWSSRTACLIPSRGAGAYGEIGDDDCTVEFRSSIANILVPEG